MPKVLFVCTANRSRSPVAAACFRKELARYEVEHDWNVASAGTWATAGLPATPGALDAARRLSLDLSGHRSSPITAEAMADSDLILVMEEGQKEALALEFPEGTNRLHLLSKAATGVAYSIPDPGSSSELGYVYDEIAELIHVGFMRLRALAAKQ